MKKIFVFCEDSPYNTEIKEIYTFNTLEDAIEKLESKIDYDSYTKVPSQNVGGFYIMKGHFSYFITEKEVEN